MVDSCDNSRRAGAKLQVFVSIRSWPLGLVRRAMLRQLEAGGLELQFEGRSSQGHAFTHGSRHLSKVRPPEALRGGLDG